MAVANTLAPKKKEQSKFSIAIKSDAYKNLINNTLGDPKRSQKFITAVTSAVSTNPALAECDAGTILSAALLGESLNLSPSPQLGQYYMVPYKCKEYIYNNDGSHAVDSSGKWVFEYKSKAQFILGYRGMLQLAQRSGEYKRINAMAIKQGELISYSPFDDEIELKFNDTAERETLPTIGYYAMFEYHNGFKKILYWSIDRMQRHAEQYSAGYRAHKGTTFWEKDFDSMGCKTMLRQLLSKWGIMSIEMRRAYESDMGVINENGTVEFVDSPKLEAPQLEAPQVDEPKISQPVTRDVNEQAEKTDSNTPPEDDFADILEG